MSGSKKSKDVGEHNYSLGDVVLAKIRGYPRWPGMVVDPESVPPAVAKERPSSKKTTFYCVRFFPAGDYSWAVSKDLSLLQKHEIEAYINEPHKKSGDLLQGYKIAMDPREWSENLEDQQAAIEEAEANEEVDQLEELDEGDEDEPVKAKASKKRKRESEPKPKKKKEPKKSASAGAESKEKKAGAKKKSGKKNGIRSKETIESEDEGAEDAEGEDAPAESSKKSGPASKRAKKDKGGDDGDFDHLANNPDAIKVKEWRHKLQRAFLSKSIPKAEEMSEYDQLFTTIENHDLTIEQLSFSKLGKVMRHISQLDPAKLPIPNDDEFNIRRRADVLLERWQSLIAAAGPDQGASAGGVNGTTADTKVEEAEKANAAKAMDVDKTNEVPVNGDVAENVKGSGNAVAGSAADAPVEPPAAEDEVAMDTADD